MKTKSTILGAMAALAALTLTSFPTAKAASGVPFTNSVVDRVYGSGSDTTYFVLNDLATAYMETDGCLLNAATFPLSGTSPQQNACQSGSGAAIPGDNTFENYDHDVVVNYFPQGSNVGRGQLCNQKSTSDGGPARDSRVPYIDFARSSSAPTTGFQCTVANGGETPSTLRFVAFARDALSWTRWAGGGGSAVTNLTQAQLRDIFITCAITDWGQVGGTAGVPIIVYTAIPGSGTRSTWDSFMGGGSSENCIPAQFKDGAFANGERVIREHQMEPVEVAANDPAAANEGNSIYYMSTGLHATSPSAGSSILGNVNGVVPSEPNIVSGTFPFSRNLYNVIRQSGASPVASGATRRFTGMVTPNAGNAQSIGWICKAEAAHSEPIGDPSAVGTEVNTATKDWYEQKEAAFVENGIYQLAPDAFGVRCTFTDVATV